MASSFVHLPFEDDLFWAKVEFTGTSADDCWLWTGAGVRYGQVSRRSWMGPHMAQAHRYSFLRTYGQLPEVVMHTCDTPRCVRPDHLRGGTQKDNVHDAARKGRHGLSSISNEAVAEIRRRIDQGEKQVDLAREFGVSEGSITHYKNGQTRNWNAE